MVMVSPVVNEFADVTVTFPPLASAKPEITEDAAEEATVTVTL